LFVFVGCVGVVVVVLCLWGVCAVVVGLFLRVYLWCVCWCVLGGCLCCLVCVCVWMCVCVSVWMCVAHHVCGSMDYRARGSWIGNAHAVLFLMYGVSACLWCKASYIKVCNSVSNTALRRWKFPASCYIINCSFLVTCTERLHSGIVYKEPYFSWVGTPLFWIISAGLL